MKCNDFHPRGRGLSSNAGTQPVKLAAVLGKTNPARAPSRKEWGGGGWGGVPLPAAIETGGRIAPPHTFESLYPVCLCVFLFYWAGGKCIVVTAAVHDLAERIAAKRRGEKRANEIEIRAQ